MKIVVAGTRGVPDIQGGVETHCEQLFPRMAALGHEVTIIRRSCYLTPTSPRSEWNGLKLRDIYAPRIKSLEAIVHTFLAVIAARRLNPDVLHIHAIGPGIMVPLARLLGMKVVVTHHGADYDRGKWGRLAKAVLKTGERMMARYASRVIVISQVIKDSIADKYGRTDTELIYNGVPEAQRTSAHDYLDSLQVTPCKYILALGRFVPEKNFHQLIEAYEKSSLSDEGIKLVIAGDADHPDAYSRSLKEQARESGVVLTGFVKGEKLRQLLSHAALFVLPSSHEGLPISLLEAMSYGIDVLTSDIAANLLPQLTEADHFPVGDITALTDAIKHKITAGATPRSYDLTPYNWNVIAQQTLHLYASL